MRRGGPEKTAPAKQSRGFTNYDTWINKMFQQVNRRDHVELSAGIAGVLYFTMKSFEPKFTNTGDGCFRHFDTLGLPATSLGCPKKGAGATTDIQKTIGLAISGKLRGNLGGAPVNKLRFGEASRGVKTAVITLAGIPG
jgi:hypothetical protein